jgi:hypothetical protein
MTAIIRADFLCSYYYHAALTSKRQITEHKLPQSLYYTITALVLWQCVLESYINFLIHKRKLEDHLIEVGQDKPRRQINLIDASIRKKWVELPIIVADKHFKLNAEPFKYFEKLVDLRNDLIHFNVAKLTFEKEVPAHITTVGELQAWMGTGEYLADTVFDRMVRFAVAGELIVRDMIRELHKMLGSKSPDFLDGSEAVLKVRIRKP